MQRARTRRSLSRRGFCAAVAASAAGTFAAGAPPRQAVRRLAIEVRRAPDFAIVYAEEGEIRLEEGAAGVWQGRGVELRTLRAGDALRVSLRATGVRPLRVLLRWRGDLRGASLFLGDHWERSYADLEWRGEMPNRAMPWYFLVHDGVDTLGIGVRTQPNAFVFWNADAQGVSLWADVRSGGVGVALGERTLEVCDVVCQEAVSGRSPFETLRAFCRTMCPAPRLPAAPVFGTNDWYYSYGNNQPAEILAATELVVSLAPPGGNRPYSVIDAGWSPGASERGPWDRAAERFGSMADFARRLSAAGARPGIWIRPLAAALDVPKGLRLARNQAFLDPTVPEALELVAADIRRLREWGYALIKHDFTSFDIVGRWGFAMGATLTDDGWAFASRARTTAEVVRDLYATIRAAAGDALLIGCNTFSHLSAGVFEANRIGDDVSGSSWDRTRRMGVNTLAFRAAHHGAFYAADPDIAPITARHAWSHGRLWLRLIAESGLPLLVSPQLAATGPEQRAALKEAFALAAAAPPLGEPLDWLGTSIPRKWKLRGAEVEFDWMAPEGPWPFRD